MVAHLKYIYNLIASINLCFFFQLFLLHMDEIIPNVVDNNNAVDAPIGCSSICVNEPNNVSPWT